MAPLKAWPDFARALGIDPNSPQAIVAGQYHLHHGPLAALQRCRKVGPDGSHEWLPSGDAFPVDRLSDKGGIFWRPACPGGHMDRHYTGSHIVFYEIDDRPLAGQWEALDRLTASTGLEPTAVVFSGSKSLHVYYQLDRALDAEGWKRLMRKLAIAQNSDPAIVSLSRLMRLPGAKRCKNGQWVEQSIERLTPGAVYAPEDFEARLDRLGLWPHGLTDERWRKWRSQRHEHGYQAPALVAPDAVLFPPRVYTPIEPIAYDGQAIPLERCLSRRERDWLASGIPQGERNANGLVLGRSLVGTYDWLVRNGYRVDGHPESLFWDCLGRSGLGEREINTLWRQATRGNPRPSLPDEALEKCIAWVIKGDRPNRSKTVGFKPSPKAKPVTPKDGAIVLYHSAYAAAGRGEFHKWAWPRIVETITYQPGHLPRFDLWQRMGCPKILYQPTLEARLALWHELIAKGYTRAIDTSEAGGGKTTALGEWMQALQAEIDRDYAIAQTDNPDGAGKRSRAILMDPDHRNPSTDSTAALTDYPSKHGGLVITKDGKIRVASPSTPADELNEDPNCPSAEIHQLLSQSGEIAPIGPEHPVCAACPVLVQVDGQWSCPVTKQIEQAKAGGAWIGHPAAVPVADGDLVGADEVDRTIPTERTRDTSWPNPEWGRLQVIAPDLYAGLMVDGVRSAQDRLMALAGKSKYGLSANDTRATFLGALSVAHDGLFDPWGDGGTIARFNRLLPETYRAYLGMLGAIEGNPTDWLLPDAERLKIQVSPTRAAQVSRFPQDLAGFLGRLGGSSLDALRELGDRAASPTMAKAAIEDAGAVRAIADLLMIATKASAAHGVSITATGTGLTITTRDRSFVNKLNKASFALLADATGNRRETAHRFGWAIDSIVEIQALPSNYSGKLRIIGLTGAGNFGADRRDESEFCAGQRIGKIRSQYLELHPGGGVFDRLDHLTGDGLEGAFFRDSRKSNDFEPATALLIIGKPIANLMAMASTFEVRYRVPVEDPLGRWDFQATNLRGHRRYCRWLRRQIIKEAVQTIARLRSQHGNAEKPVYVVGWPQWLIDGVLDYFPGAASESQSIHQFCPEAAPKGSQTDRRVMEAIAGFVAEGLTPTIQQVAAKAAVVKGTVSKAVKSLTGLDYRKAIESFQLLFRGLYNKWKPENLPPASLALADRLKQLAIDLLDGAIAPDEAREAIAQSFIESGETLTEQAIAALPAPEHRALRAIVDRSTVAEWLQAQVAIHGRGRVTGGRAIEQLDDRELAAIAVQRHMPLSDGGYVD